MSVFAISASGLRVGFRRQDVFGDNIANAVTPGFRASRVNVADMRGGGAGVAAIQTILRQGPLDLLAGDPFALAIEGDGFFEVMTARGPRYTRVGSFGLDAAQQLVSPSSGAVVRDVNGQAISIPLGGLTTAGASSQVSFSGNLNGAGAQAFNGTVLESARLIDNASGAAATNATLLTNLSRLPEGAGPAVDLNLNAGGAIGVQATKGGRALNANFTIGTALAPGAQGFGTTLGDFASFLQRSLGINTGATDTTFGAIRGTGAGLQAPASSLIDANANGLTDRVQVAGTDFVACGAKVGDVIEFRTGAAAGLKGSIAGFTTTATANDTLVLASEIPASEMQPVIGDQFSVHEPPRVTIGNQTTQNGAGTPQLGNGSDDGRLRIAGNAGTVNQLVVTISGLPFFERRAADGESALSMTTVFDSLGKPRTLEVASVLEAKGGVDSSTGAPGNLFRFFGESDESLATNPAFGIDRVVGTGTVRYATTGRFLSTSPSPAFTLNLGNEGAATPLTVSPDFRATSGFAADSRVFATGQDGAPTGTLSDFSIGADGTVTGIFTNGRTQTLSQIRLVRFANPGGLIREGGNLLAPGPNSGLPIAGAPGRAGFGGLVFGALEGSNVDLGEELVGQLENKSFTAANLKTIKAQDEMLGSLLDVLR